MKDIYQLLQEFTGYTRNEADNTFVIQDEGTSWKVKTRTYLEYATFKSMISLVREFKGDYFREDGQACFRIPKPETPQGVAPELLNTANRKTPQYQILLLDAVKEPKTKCRVHPDFELNELIESIRKQGVCEPILARPLPSGYYECVAGHRRLRAAKAAGLTEIPAIVKEMDDVEAMVIQITENVQRKDLTEDEKSMALANLARATGWKAKQIAEVLGMSERWVYKYLPQDFKDKEKVKAGALGGAVKAEKYRESQDFAARRAAKPQDLRHEATQLDNPDFLHIQQQIAQQLTQCEGCGRRVHRTRLKIVKGKLLCPLCRGEKPQQPQRERQVKVAKPKDTWQYRKAQMQPQHSQMELAVLEKLNALGVPVETDVPFCVQRTIPDFYFPTKNVAVYLDGPVHKGREDRDENQRELLARLYGITVVSISYERRSTQEADRIMQEIKEAIQ